MKFAEVQQEREFVQQGDQYDSKGQYDQALAAYDRALGIDPEDADAWYDKAETLVKMGRGDEARTCFQQAMGLYCA
jgi:tetratricopeptide (TPR) repeat protein